MLIKSPAGPACLSGLPITESYRMILAWHILHHVHCSSSRSTWHCHVWSLVTCQGVQGICRNHGQGSLIMMIVTSARSDDLPPHNHSSRPRSVIVMILVGHPVLTTVLSLLLQSDFVNIGHIMKTEAKNNSYITQFTLPASTYWSSNTLETVLKKMMTEMRLWKLFMIVSKLRWSLVCDKSPCLLTTPPQSVSGGPCLNNCPMLHTSVRVVRKLFYCKKLILELGSDILKQGLAIKMPDLLNFTIALELMLIMTTRVHLKYIMINHML